MYIFENAIYCIAVKLKFINVARLALERDIGKEALWGTKEKNVFPNWAQNSLVKNININYISFVSV